MNATRVRIFYPADPLGVVPGGIDTFIRGLIKWAPDDLRFSLVGMTTDVVARPLRRFSRCTLGQREFDFFPAVRVAAAAQRGRVPLSLRFSAAVLARRAQLARDFDVFDFHRLEPALLFAKDTRPKNAFFHQDPRAVESAASDILWKRAPRLYRGMEARAMAGVASAWCVRESGVTTLRERYPAHTDRIDFIPTWVDPDVFAPVSRAERELLHAEWGARLELDPEALRIVTVGRLDTQKDPELMLDAFARLVAEGRRLVWLVVGDGALRPKLERKVEALGLDAHVRFLGLQSPAQIAELMQSVDAYALSSAYEGMPMALLEALGSGLPVATTDVGEVRRVVRPGVNGSIAVEPGVDAFAHALADVLDRLAHYRGLPAIDATTAYQPARVLQKVYDNYRALGEVARARGHSTHAGPGSVASSLAPTSVHSSMLSPVPPREPYPQRRRERVIGAPVDVIGAADARATIIGWARARESRYVCFCNVHSAVAFAQDKRHRRAIEHADLVTPDGAPIAWMLRRKGHAGQPRVDGPNTMWALCRDAQSKGVKVGLYGSTPDTLRALRLRMRRAFPTLHVSFCEAPPFKRLSHDEDEAVCAEIEEAGVGLLFVALGCPKQEHWMAEHAGRLRAVMLGVGAAFDFHAGLVARAPAWAQDHGLEWLHRLLSEPRRLWRRYLMSNSVFLLRGAGELAATRARRPTRRRPQPTLETRPGTARALGDKRMNEHYMAELLARVDATILRHNGRVIEFIASGKGEGTSTLAAAYAHFAAEQLGRRVLLLDATTGSSGHDGVLDALAGGRDMQSAVHRHAGGYWRGALFGTDESGWTLGRRNELWRVLRGAFDEVVLDMPSSAVSHAGLMVAPHCDGVIVVLEAEKTRAPVVEALIANLQAVHANLLGTVLNKRQFHLPDALYRRL